MDDENERKGLLSNESRIYPTAPSGNNDQVPSYQETINANRTSYPAPGYAYAASTSTHAPPPPQPIIIQPNYQTMPYIQTQVILVGGCPTCRVGVLEDDYTCCGICCALFFFPLGVLFCLATKQRRCSNCGAVYD